MGNGYKEERGVPPPSRHAAPSRGAPRSSRRSEFDFIERLRRREAAQTPTRDDSKRGSHHSSVIKGIGDDAAVLRHRAGFETVVTADLLVEGIDFDFDSLRASPRDVGHKALAVSLSDVAAMGATPHSCLLSVGLPRARWEGGFLEEFYAGVRTLARRHGVSIIGGDVSRTPERVVVDSMVLGEVRTGRAVLRSGARPGDLLYVTGSLGAAAAGLRVLQEEVGREYEREDDGARSRARTKLVMRQSRPSPRVEWGQFLGAQKLATAMIDLSDGLSSDLAHLCRESGVGARVDAARLPVEGMMRAAGFGASEALGLALDGGEDFELLFTARPRRSANLDVKLDGVRSTLIGEITDAAGEVELVEDGRARPLAPAGFEHFT